MTRIRSGLGHDEPMLVVAGESIAVTTLGPGSAASSEVAASGAPAIAAWVAAGLGTQTGFLSAVGDDDHGRLIVATLRAAGVDPAGLLVRSDRPTAHATVAYDEDGSRRFEFDVAGSAAVTLDVADLGDWPERADWIHISGSAVLFGDPLAGAIEALVERGLAAGTTVSVDPNLREELADPQARGRLARLCRQVHVLFPSDDELGVLGLSEDELLGRGAIVCTTAAADGVRLQMPGAEPITLPAVARAEDVVDPDGAGDTFAGATVAARMAGLDWIEAVTSASRIVARAIAVPGPMTVELDPADLGPTRPDGDPGRVGRR